VAPSPAKGHHVTLSAVGSGDGDPDSSGQPVPVEIKVSPMLDSSGRITGLVVVFRDISERRRQAERQALLLDLIRASEPGELGRATLGMRARKPVTDPGVGALGPRVSDVRVDPKTYSTCMAFQNPADCAEVMKRLNGSAR
jgi:hypothetical protein